MLFFVCLIGAITPGPDIFLVIRNCLKFGFLTSIKILCGIATGWIIMFAIIYVGLAKFVQSNIIQAIIGAIGGIYLIYVAFHLIKSKECDIKTDEKSSADSYLKALIINISNPKAILFFIIILSPFIEKGLSISIAISFFGLLSGFLIIIAACCLFRSFISPYTFMIIDRICAVLFFIFALLLIYNAYIKINT